MPFQTSPCKDDGYDVADYYNVDPRYGTLGDFVEFAHGAKQRGIRVLIDLVVNHTSNEHPWFQQARRSPNSKYRDWYVWSKKKPANANKGMVFPGVQKTTWSYDDVAKAYFQHGVDTLSYIHVSEPDLTRLASENFANLIVLGHIASDWLGINRLLGELKKKDVEPVASTDLYKPA